jgi:hypothetical protein
MSVVMMEARLSGIEWVGLGRLHGIARLAVGLSGRPEETASQGKSRIGWLPVALIAGVGAWMLISGYASKPAESEPGRLTASATSASARAPIPEAVQAGPLPDPGSVEAVTSEQAAPVDGLKISSQSWRRGGLGSKALVTLTLRNSNDYAVKDIEISCAFARRDGSQLTERTRTIHDVVNMKSRRTFARMHVGFVNINANRAKCSLVAASRI